MADAFPLSGGIDPKAFPFLVMNLHRQGATGSLKVDGVSYQKALYFRGGRILFGSSNDPRDQLGAILIESGKITPEQLEDVNAKVGPGNPLAKVLSESGFVNQRELGEAARAKVERILSDVIAYTSGSYEFEDGVLPKGAVDLKLSTERAMLAAIRRLTDRNFVLRYIESLEVVLSPAPDLAAKLGEIQSETLGLTEQLNGKRSLKEAASLARIEEFEAAKVACALLFLGLIQKGPAAAPDEEATIFVTGEEAGGAELDLSQTARIVVEPDAPTVTMPAPSGPEVAEEHIEASEAEVSPPSPPPAPQQAPSAPETGHNVKKPAPAVDQEATMMFPAPTRAPEPRIPAPEPERAHAPANPAPPNKEDMAALDALLNPHSLEGPLEPLEKADEWRPQFLPTEHGPATPNRRSGGNRRPVLMGAIVVFVLLGLASGAWFYLNRDARPTPTVRAAAGTPPSTTPTPKAEPTTPVSTPATAAPATATPGPAAPNPGTTPAPKASPATAPAARPTPPPPTTTTLAAKATPTTTLPPKPAPTTQPAKAASTTKTVPAAGGAPGLVEARGSLRKGDLAEAARGFVANLKAVAPGSYSLQILVACTDDTVHKAVKNAAAPELYIVPVNYKGRDCYRLCWGIYENQAHAEAALHVMPEYFHKGGATPKAVATSGLVP